MRRRAFGLWAWVLVALVLAQSLGSMHNVVHAAASHAERQDNACPGVQQDNACPAEQHEQLSADWLERLFATHDEESECRLYDQVSHGDCVPTLAVLFAPLPAAAGLVEAWAASYPSTRALLARARGPPSVH